MFSGGGGGFCGGGDGGGGGGFCGGGDGGGGFCGGGGGFCAGDGDLQFEKQFLTLYIV